MDEQHKRLSRNIFLLIEVLYFREQIPIRSYKSATLREGELIYSTAWQIVSVSEQNDQG